MRSARMTGAVLLTIVPLAVAAGSGDPPASADDFASVPLATVTPNDRVKTILRIGDVAYIGGDFTRIGPATGSGAVIDTRSAKPDARWPQVGGGSVDVAASDLRGGWYIAGEFTHVGPVPRSGIAHLTAGRKLDIRWAPRINGDGVRVLAVSPRSVYVGGAFEQAGGGKRRYLAVVDRSRGAVRPFGARPTHPVTALTLAGATLYFGIAALTSTTNDLVTAVDATSGRRLPFRVRARVNPCRDVHHGDCVATPRVDTLVAHGRTLFVAGFFNVVNGTRRVDAAAFESATGRPLAWSPNPKGSITAMALDQDTIYAAGFFTRIGGRRRAHLAALDLTEGKARPWSAHAARAVIALAVDARAVYAAVDTYEIPENGLAAYDRRTGRRLKWRPAPNGFVATLARYGRRIFVGGSFTGFRSAQRPGLAAINLRTGALEPWSPHVAGRYDPPHPTIDALATDGLRLFVGGEFAHIDGVRRNNLAAFDLPQRSLASWNPGADSDVLALAASGGSVFAGGYFRELGGTPHSRLGKIDASTGAVAPRVTDLDDSVLALSIAGGTLYVGGVFDEANGVPRGKGCAVDAQTMIPLPWDPKADYPVWALAAASGTVYAGGVFTEIGGIERSALAALDPVTASVQEPDLRVADTVGALALHGSTLYAGGDFTRPTRNLAAFDLGSHTLVSWRPEPDGEVHAIVANDDAVLVGGDFSRIGGVVRPNFAIFRRE
jgi:hypothetical protein